MCQEPKKVPLLFGRDKILALNKQLLKEQQNAVEPQLKIRISSYVIPDFSGAFIKSIKEYREKLKTARSPKNHPKANVIKLRNL